MRSHERRNGSAPIDGIRARRVGSRRGRVVLATALPALFCASRALADNLTWTGTPGTQSYSIPGNWLPSGPPGINDIAVFNSNQTNTIEVSSNQTHLGLQVLQGSVTFQPEAGVGAVQRTMSLQIDSFINGATLVLSGLPGPDVRGLRMELSENLFVGGDLFTAGSPSGLTILTGAELDVGSNLKLWNAGTVTLDGGVMQVGTFDHTGGGTFQFTGGRLHAGTFLGNLTNAGGTIAPGTSAGVTHVTGNLQMNSGAIEIELGGFTPGADNDQLQVSGSAAFGTGDVVIKTLDNFIPLPGDVFEIVTYASASGTPDIVNQTPFAGLSFTHMLTASTLAIRAQALVLGDADLNAIVDVRDLLAMANHWLGPGNWLEGDFDGNGFVDQADLTLLAQNWQPGITGAPFAEAANSLGLPGSSVPEPGATFLLIAGGLLLCRRRSQNPFDAVSQAW